MRVETPDKTLVWARVVEVERQGLDWVLRVVPERRDACGGCAAQSTCGVGLLDRWFSQRSRDFRALDPSGHARVGDRVGLTVSDRSLAGAALAVYLLPLLGLIGGAVVGRALAGDQEGVAMLAGLSGFGLALMVVHLFSRWGRRFALGLPRVVTHNRGPVPSGPLGPARSVLEVQAHREHNGDG